MASPKNIDDYIEHFPDRAKKKLKQLRKIISDMCPEAEEYIGYQMPAFKLNNKPLVYFSGYEHHIGFYAIPSAHKAFEKELANYKRGKGSVQFPLDQPLPISIIKKMIAFRIKENLQLLSREKPVKKKAKENTDTKNGIKTFQAKTRNEWRKWLEKNHEKEKSCWLIIYHKKSDVKSVYYDEAVEEALCFGWIDSKPNKRDEESSFLFFSQRNPKSKWSKLNKERVARLTKEKKILPAGQRLIDEAKKSGTWNALDVIDNIVIPDDLQKLFDKNKKAYENFKAFPPSSKKIILLWIEEARRSETREKRIEESVALAAKNIRANHYRQ